MNGIIQGKFVHLILSRRNLEILLKKLDKPESAHTIFAMVYGNHRVYVTSEENAIHYRGRTPGLMKEDPE